LRFYIALFSISFLVTFTTYSDESNVKTPVVSLAYFENSGIDKKFTNLFTEKIGSDLASNKLFNVTIGSELNSVLKDVGLRSTDCKLNDTLCLVKAGKLMNYSHIISGSIEKVKKDYTIKVRIIDVESKKISHIKYEDCIDCSEKDLLLTSANVVSAKIAEKIMDISALEKKLKQNDKVDRKYPVAKKKTEKSIFKNKWTYIGLPLIATTGIVMAVVLLNDPDKKIVEKKTITIDVE